MARAVQMLVVLAGILMTSVESAHAMPVVVEIEIEALIDGRDLLIIDDNTLQWDHREFAAVGRVWERNEPTFISTWRDGVLQMDRVPWIPEWSEPPPNEIRWPELSSVFEDLVPVLPNAPMEVTLTPIEARHSLSILEAPTAANGYAVVVDFDDGPPSGDVWYSGLLEIRYDTSDPEVIPEPATCVILLIGILGQRLKRRRWSG
jgi:hypothetical protein